MTGEESGIDYSWPRISVVIPTLNEALNLPHVFAQISDDIDEVILVDGHSVDDTVAVARRLKPDVRVVMQTRKGKGNALACGFAAATGDIIVMVDADGSADLREIPQFVQALLDGADFAKGTRFAKGGGSADITRLRGFGNSVLSGLVNLLYGTRYSDLCYGYNAFWRKIVPVLDLDIAPLPPNANGRQWGDGFEIETLINIRFAKAGLAITEVPSFEHARIHGVSNLNATSDGLRVLRIILREYTRYHRRTARVAIGPDRSSANSHGAQSVMNDRPRDQLKQSLPLVMDMDMEQNRQRAIAGLTASVVVCVYTEKRWPQIERALSSIAEQTVQPEQVIVVADHNSALCQRLAVQYPALEVIPNKFEPGLSGARNTGIDQAKGDVVVFLDDDACAEPGWLESLLACYDDESVLGAGGLVLADWSSADRPGWLPEEFLWVVGCSYQGLPKAKTEVRNPIGANMSFRRSAFDMAGHFDSSVGRNVKVTRPLGCEETEFSIRLQQISPGSRILYEPRAVVHHHVDRSRRTWRYFLGRCYAEGFSKARVAKLSGMSSALSSERTYVIHAVRQALYREFSALCRRGSKDALGRLTALLLGVSWTAAGFAGATISRMGFPFAGKSRSR